MRKLSFFLLCGGRVFPSFPSPRILLTFFLLSRTMRDAYFRQVWFTVFVRFIFCFLHEKKEARKHVLLMFENWSSTVTNWWRVEYCIFPLRIRSSTHEALVHKEIVVLSIKVIDLIKGSKTLYSPPFTVFGTRVKKAFIQRFSFLSQKAYACQINPFLIKQSR